MSIVHSENYLAALAAALDVALEGQESSPLVRTLGLSRDSVYELLARQRLLPDVLRECLASGHTLLHEMAALVGEAAGSQAQGFVAAAQGHLPPGPAVSGFDALSTAYNALLDLMHQGMMALDAALPGAVTAQRSRIADLLRRVAEWEHGYLRAHHEAIAALRGAPATSAAQQIRPLSPERLEAALQASAPLKAARVTSVRELTGGMGKRTYVATLDNGGNRREVIVRQQLPSTLIEGPNTTLENEFALLRTLRRTALPVPEAYLLCTDPGLTDMPYIVMPKIAGAAPGSFFGATSEITETLVQDLATRLAQLHAIPLEHFSDYIDGRCDPAVLGDTVTSCYQRAIAHYRRRVQEAGLDTSLTMDYLLHWLETHVPSDDRRPVLVHGDGNFHNVLAEGQTITAVLDWELADFGAPEQDLGYVRRQVEAVLPWERFIGFYNAAGGRDIREQDVPFYMAYQALRLFFSCCNGTARLAQPDAMEPRFLEIDMHYLPAVMDMIMACTRPA